MKINARLYRMIVKVLLTVVILVVAGVAAFVGMQISGRNRLYQKSGRPNLSISELSEEIDQDSLNVRGSGENVGSEEAGNNSEAYTWQEGDVRYQGAVYRYNEDILTFLFLGIDKKDIVKPVKNGIDGGQSDAIFLLVLNPHKKELSVIGVPRDTMAELAVYNEDGDYRGAATAQLALQHGYGDGAELSCERTVEAVSNLFYQLPVHGYCAINMGAISLLNDAVGGIEVVALEDVINSDIREGDTILLQGEQAYQYLHNRQYKGEGSAGSAGRRLERQKQYLTAYAAKATEMMKTDITLPVTLYTTLSKYMVTDVTVDEVSYLAAQITDYRFESKNMYSLEGETVKGERYEEFYADEKALYELILNVFYEEVGQVD